MAEVKDYDVNSKVMRFMERRGLKAAGFPQEKKDRKTRTKRALQSLLDEKFPGYNAVISMVQTAQLLEKEAFEEMKIAIEEGDELMPTGSINLLKEAAAIHEKVARFTTPQLKAVDITSGGERVSFSFGIIPPDQPKVVNE